MADNKAATAAAQTQSDKPKKNDGKKKVSFFDKVKNFFKGIGKYFKDTKSELKKVVWPSKNDVKTNTITVIVGRAGRSCRADPVGPHLWRRHPPVDRRLSALSGGKDNG